MKTVLPTVILLLAGWSATAQTFPERGNTAVIDTAHVLSLDQARILQTKLADFQHRTGHDLIIATVPSLQGYPIADYGYRLGRAWGSDERAPMTERYCCWHRRNGRSASRWDTASKAI